MTSFKQHTLCRTPPHHCFITPMQDILGDLLYTTPPDETMDRLPSPEYFRGKILVKVYNRDRLGRTFKAKYLFLLRYLIKGRQGEVLPKYSQVATCRNEYSIYLRLSLPMQGKKPPPTSEEPGAAADNDDVCMAVHDGYESVRIVSIVARLFH